MHILDFPLPLTSTGHRNYSIVRHAMGVNIACLFLSDDNHFVLFLLSVALVNFTEGMLAHLVITDTSVE